MHVALRLIVCVLALHASTIATGHDPGPQWRSSDKAQHTVHAWANGLLNGDAASVEATLAEPFSYLGGPRRAYLTSIANQHAGRVLLDFATYEPAGEHILVSPVVVYEHRLVRNPLPLALTLTHLNGEWRISQITLAPQVPAALLDRPLPEHHALRRTAVHLRDDATGEPIAARVHVTDGQDHYWPPEGHMAYVPTGWNESVGGDVVIDGKAFAYVRPDFVLPLPPGQYEMQIERGPEYLPERLRFDVPDAGRISPIDIRLKRWSNLQAQGWYSGDTHVHFLDPQTAMLEIEGEDLNVANILATKWGELITSAAQFTGGPSPLSTAGRIVYVNEEARHDFLGHINLLNLKSLIHPLSWGEGGSGVPGGFDYPPLAHLADAARAQDGLVSWAHFPFPNGELATDIALGKVDAIDLVTWGSPFDDAAGLSSTEIWYRFLNCGFDLPALGGTDKMWNTQIVGGVRTYVKVDGPFSYQAWIDGIKTGQTFVTTGPSLMLSVAGHGPGAILRPGAGEKIAFRAEARYRTPIDRIEIIQNGEVVATQTNVRRDTAIVLEGQLDVTASTWVAARAYSSETLPYQGGMREAGIPVLAHTSPVYIEIDGRPRRSPEDAAFFVEWAQRAIEWADSRARFRDDRQRQEMIALFERAKAVYVERAR